MNRYDGAICNYTLGKNSRKQIKHLLSFNRTANSNIRSSLITKRRKFHVGYQISKNNDSLKINRTKTLKSLV
jgi:hypothetical protein